MKKNIVIFSLIMLLQNIYAIDGEYFFKTEGFDGISYQFKFEKIAGETYYDSLYQIVSPPDLVFSYNEQKVIQADIVTGDNNNGWLDDNDKEFLVYLGKFKITLIVGGNSYIFYINTKDCDLPPLNHYTTPDYYFKIVYGTFNWIRTNSDFSLNFGNITNTTFELWSVKDSGHQTPNTSCFPFAITPRNIVNATDYGELYVDNENVNSGEEIYLLPNTYEFRTYTDFIDVDKKFRDWLASFYFENPINILIDEHTEIPAYFYKTLPLTLTNNLEGGESGNYEVVWQQGNKTEQLESGSDYNAFEYITPTFDEYNLEALSVSAYNTDWQFLYWGDDPTDVTNPKEDVKVKSSTNNSYTANYKGHLRSNSSNAFSSNSQRKLVRTNDGIYHTLYTSDFHHSGFSGLHSKLWYSKSSTSNFENSWIFEQQLPTTLSDVDILNPSMDYYNDTLQIVFEWLDPYPGVESAGISWVTYHPASGFSQRREVATFDYTYFGNAKPVIASIHS